MLIIQAQNLRSFAGTIMGFAFSPSLNGDSLKTVPSGHFREVKNIMPPALAVFIIYPGAAFGALHFCRRQSPCKLPAAFGANKKHLHICSGLIFFILRQLLCGLTCLLYTIAEFFADFVASFMDKQRKILYAIIK